jgi:UDP-glucose 4-epimerase
MTVLVTGGGGFLGAWTIRRLLRRGKAVRVLDATDSRTLARSVVGAAAKELDWRVGDISRTEDVDQAMEGCDGVIHLAGLLTPACQDNPIRGAQVNLIGTLNVFEAAKRLQLRKVIYTSSVSVFGRDSGELPLPSTHYGAFKLACEGCARTYWEYDGLSSIGFRPAVVYGPGRETGLTGGISMACRAAVRAEAFTIGFSGATDFVFVDDVAAALEQALLIEVKGLCVQRRGRAGDGGRSGRRHPPPLSRGRPRHHGRAGAVLRGHWGRSHARDPARPAAHLARTWHRTDHRALPSSGSRFTQIGPDPDGSQ